VANFHAKRTYIFSRNAIEELRKDHFLLIISGSPLEIVKEYASIFDFDAYFGSVYEVDNQGVYTGGCDVSAARNKDMVVKKFIAERGFSLEDSFGIGDTESDAKFLRMVSRPVAFNPNAELRRIAQEEGW
jgi:phosphoserine phosphatase